MELTELMVGDWVFVSGNPVKITKDDLATILIFLDDDSKLSPITLTEEILEWKFTFQNFIYQSVSPTGCRCHNYRERRSEI